MNDICVLMSTYNAIKKTYLQEQIDSILSQEKVKITLVIRDDGSTDETVSLLNTYADNHNNIIVIEGANLGWRESFCELLRIAPNASYYAFADQDDYWMPDKLQTAIHKIEKIKGSCLYRGSSLVSDETLNPTKHHYLDVAIPTRKDALFQNFCQGCTLVFNNELKELALRAPVYNIAHDVWIPLVAIYTGTIISDDTPHMLHRSHENSQTASSSKMQNLMRLMKRATNCRVGALELLSYYKEYLAPEEESFCQLIVTYKTSLSSKIKLLIYPYKTLTSRKRFLVRFSVLRNGLGTSLQEN